MTSQLESVRAQLHEKEKELLFYKRELTRLSNKNLRELEEQSKYTALLNQKIKIIDSHQQQLATILDCIPADVFICDMESYTVLFMNAFMKRSFNKDCVGDRCYQVFQNRDAPCTHCTNGELLKTIGELDKVITWEGKNTVNNRWYLNHDIAVPWVNGKNVRMEVAIDISSRIQIEEELKKSREEYASLFRMLRLMCDNVPDMMWAKDLEKNYIFTNKALCETLLMATDTEEPLGKNDLFFARRERNSKKEIADWHTFGELCQDSDVITMKEKKPLRFDEYGNVKGKFLFLDVHKAPFLDEKGKMIGTVGSARDITIAKERDSKLKDQETKYRKKIENQYRVIIKTTQEGVCSVDNELRILFANQKMADILGRSLADIYGEKLGHFISSQEKEKHFDRLRNSPTGLNESYEEKIVHQNGHIRYVRISATLTEDEQGGTTAFSSWFQI